MQKLADSFKFWASRRHHAIVRHSENSAVAIAHHVQSWLHEVETFTAAHAVTGCKLF
jgi:hypothetical protein